MIWRTGRTIAMCLSTRPTDKTVPATLRSEEHTSELQSQSNLVCRLLLEKKKKNIKHLHHYSLINSTEPNFTSPSYKMHIPRHMTIDTLSRHQCKIARHTAIHRTRDLST